MTYQISPHLDLACPQARQNQVKQIEIPSPFKSNHTIPKIKQISCAPEVNDMLFLFLLCKNGKVSVVPSIGSKYKDSKNPKVSHCFAW